ncbi:Tyrosine-protein phosphatase [Drechslerella dactyloides]|uniref:protein-tyrosine-phosphatase n=1 Tax=Drechslerella dactyloides TaxID=74499 RepID=A0AAD6J0F4_DREDA|nr:Tyrosine-protein phosphatase [Drechslerella dactyloides]
MISRPAAANLTLDLPDLKSGASAAKVLEKILQRRESNMSIDKIGDTDVYISGMYAMRRPQYLEEANITHVVSILRGKMDERLFAPYKHLHVEVDDEDDENLLEHFATTNEFIDNAINSGGSVFVHCAMGISRSATICAAYLIFKKQIPTETALDIIRETRPCICPNLGFREQLDLYYQNLAQAIENLNDVPAYQRFLYRKEVEISRMADKAPTITYWGQDESPTPNAESLKCKMCRRTLALSQSFVDHTPKPPVTATSRDIAGTSGPKATCQHHFIDPVVWMRPELEKGLMEGKLECPKCNAKVGSYAWHGIKCTCGRWVVPAISLARSRVDEVRPRPAL